MGHRACIDPYEGPFVVGVDVSRYQSTIDWQRVAQSGQIGFAIIRTGDGVTEDSRFHENWKAAGLAGIRRGTYQYWRATRDPVEQADLMARQIKRAGGLRSCDLPPVIDIEEAGQGGLPIETVLARAKIWLDRIEKRLGRVPMIYTGQYWHWQVSQARPDLAAMFARYPLWVPSYGTPCARMPVAGDDLPGPWPVWAFWQYTNEGRVDGIPAKVDMNRFRGDEKALDRFAAASQVMGKLRAFFVNLTPFGDALDKRDC